MKFRQLSYEAQIFKKKLHFNPATKKGEILISLRQIQLNGILTTIVFLGVDRG